MGFIVILRDALTSSTSKLNAWSTNLGGIATVALDAETSSVSLF